ncbi:hypothetical protein M409DRAFT_61787, partial [Zasmidium cellare ATCC 36951]
KKVTEATLALELVHGDFADAVLRNLFGLRSTRSGASWNDSNDPSAKNLIPEETLFRMASGGNLAAAMMDQLTKHQAAEAEKKKATKDETLRRRTAQKQTTGPKANPPKPSAGTFSSLRGFFPDPPAIEDDEAAAQACITAAKQMANRLEYRTFSITPGVLLQQAAEWAQTPSKYILRAIEIYLGDHPNERIATAQAPAPDSNSEPTPTPTPFIIPIINSRPANRSKPVKRDSLAPRDSVVATPSSPQPIPIAQPDKTLPSNDDGSRKGDVDTPMVNANDDPSATVDSVRDQPMSNDGGSTGNGADKQEDEHESLVAGDTGTNGGIEPEPDTATRLTRDEIDLFVTNMANLKEVKRFGIAQLQLTFPKNIRRGEGNDLVIEAWDQAGTPPLRTDFPPRRYTFFLLSMSSVANVQQQFPEHGMTMDQVLIRPPPPSSSALPSSSGGVERAMFVGADVRAPGPPIMAILYGETWEKNAKT